MTVDVEHAPPEAAVRPVAEHPLQSLLALGSLGWLAMAGTASLAAGAIHAAAIGAHSEHRQAVVLFTLVAAMQCGFGAAALARPGRLLLALSALVNVGLIGGWLMAKTIGLPIEGLAEAEPVQLADVLAASLAAVAVLAVVAHLMARGTSTRIRRPIVTGVAAIVVAALAVPGMFATGGHAHGEGAEAASHGAPGHEVAAVASKPYDPALPIDLGGTDGVTPQQQAAAENLLAVTIVRLPQFAAPAKAETMGFRSIGDGLLGHEHYLNVANMTDDKILDPDYPESLVYDTSVTPKRLVSAMFMMDVGDTLADVPELGGKLTQWHVHDNLCFTDGRVSGLTLTDGSCAPPSAKGAAVPMIHVWIEPHPCGPFSALDGVAAGSVAKGEAQRCDRVHGAH